MIKIVDSSNINDAISVRDDIFSKLSKNDFLSIEASINEAVYKNWYLKNSILWLRYWLIYVDEVPAGIVGLYEEKEDSNSIWLGWYGVKSSFRNQNLGKKLLDFAIDKATNLKYRKLHLYTGTEDIYKNAIYLYEKYDFRITKENKNSIYFSKIL